MTNRRFFIVFCSLVATNLIHHVEKSYAQEFQDPNALEQVQICFKSLKSMGVKFTLLPSIKQGRCGHAFPIEISSIGGDKSVVIEPAATVSCELARSLHFWVKNHLQPSAERLFDHKVKSLQNVSSYVCRNRYNNKNKRLSEHALANALDIAAFTLADGRKISYLNDWQGYPKGFEPSVSSTKKKQYEEQGLRWETNYNYLNEDADLEGEFLAEVHGSACQIFGTVLGPEANEAHKDHLHIDMKARKRSNYCQ